MPAVNSYYSWYSSANQTTAGANTVTPLKVTGTLPNTGAGTITLSNASTNATFTVSNAGTYEITFNATVTNTGSDALVSMWGLVSGAAIANSNISATVANNHTLAISNTFTTNLSSATPLTFAWLATDANVSLATYAAVAGKQPVTPSFLVSIKQLSSSWRPANIWFVSKDVPANRWMDGGFESPYNTIQAAITAAEAVSTSAGPQVVLIYPGTYAETLTITKGYVSLVGFANSQFSNGVVSIVAGTGASHTINITNAAFGSLHLNQTVFSNVTLAAASGTAASVPTVQDISTRPHGVIFNQTQLIGRTCGFDNAATASDMRVYFNDCEVAQAAILASPLPLLRHACGALIMYKTNFTNLSNSHCLSILNAGVLWAAYLCSFVSTTADAAAEPIVRLASSVVYPQAFGLCSFTYSNPTAKASTASAGITLAGATSQQIQLTQSLFTLLGTPSDGDAVHIDGSAVHQVWQKDNYAFNTLSGGYSTPPAHYINAPSAAMVPLQSYVA